MSELNPDKGFVNVTLVAGLEIETAKRLHPLLQKRVSDDPWAVARGSVFQAHFQAIESWGAGGIFHEGVHRPIPGYFATDG